MGCNVVSLDEVMGAVSEVPIGANHEDARCDATAGSELSVHGGGEDNAIELEMLREACLE